MGTELRNERLVADPVTGFGSRAALLARLARAVDPGSGPSVLAVFGLDGLEEFEQAHGTARANEVIARLADDFARMVGRAAPASSHAAASSASSSNCRSTR